MGGLQQRCLWEVVTPRLSGAASLNGEQRAIIRILLRNMTEITGGPNGIGSIPKPTLFGLTFE
ncbi:hypothetical protein ACLXBB_22015, partial [Pseudomonas aeruginosa]